jgi:hypothetical protein
MICSISFPRVRTPAPLEGKGPSEAKWYVPLPRKSSEVEWTDVSLVVCALNQKRRFHMARKIVLGAGAGFSKTLDLPLVRCLKLLPGPDLEVLKMILNRYWITIPVESKAPTSYAKEFRSFFDIHVWISVQSALESILWVSRSCGSFVRNLLGFGDIKSVISLFESKFSSASKTRDEVMVFFASFHDLTFFCSKAFVSLFFSLLRDRVLAGLYFFNNYDGAFNAFCKVLSTFANAKQIADKLFQYAASLTLDNWELEDLIHVDQAFEAFSHFVQCKTKKPFFRLRQKIFSTEQCGMQGSLLDPTLSQVLNGLLAKRTIRGMLV